MASIFDQPAVITRLAGKRRITYIGTILVEELMSAAADWIIRNSGVVPAMGPTHLKGRGFEHALTPTTT